MHRLSEFLQDTDGYFSAMRLAMLCWVVGVLTVWCYVCFKTGTIVELPSSITAALGVMVGGKVAQKFGEKDEQPPK